MSVDAKLTAKTREQLGSANSRRLRRDGQVPGNVYGHKQGTVAIQTSHESLLGVVQGGHIAVDLEVDGQGEKAIFREVQWDTFGKKILHFDLLRVDPEERIDIEVPVDVRGTAPGVLSGGILDVQMHSLSVNCLAYKIPSSITVRIGSLNEGDAIRAGDITLAEGITITNPADAVVVQVVTPRRGKKDEEEVEEAEGGEEAAEGGEE